jgi:hypothetical protein
VASSMVDLTFTLYFRLSHQNAYDLPLISTVGIRQLTCYGFTRGVFKTFGKWYQKTNKTEDTKQINFICFQNNRHPSQHTLRNVHKASGNCQ